MGELTMLTLREAAEAVGMSKPGLLKAIKSGKVSAEKDLNGQYQIQPVELFRVYSPAKTVNGNHEGETQSATLVNGNGARGEDPAGEAQVNASLREKVTLLERLLDEKERVITLMSAENQRLTAVVAQLSPPKAQRGWWQRLLGGGQ